MKMKTLITAGILASATVCGAAMAAQPAAISTIKFYNPSATAVKVFDPTKGQFVSLTTSQYSFSS